MILRAAWRCTVSDACKHALRLACRLAPLGVCIPSVALEFVALTQRLSLLPNASALAAAAQATARAQRPLETFFPFDPYLLRKSAARLQLRSSYLRWSQVKAAAQACEAAALEGEAAGSGEEAEMGSSSSSSSDSDSAADSDASECSSRKLWVVWILDTCLRHSLKIKAVS